MQSRFINAFLLLIFSMPYVSIAAQTSTKGDTMPPIEEAISTNQQSTPSFDRLTPAEQMQVLEYIKSKGVSMDQIIGMAYEALPTDAQEDAQIYSDFVLLSREEMPVTDVKYDSDMVEFGILKLGQSKIETLSFTNTGSTPYVISNIATSCACVEAKFDKTPVMPGEKGEVRFILNSAGYEPVAVQVNISIRDNSSPNRRQIVQAVGAFELKKPKRDKL